MPYSAWRWTTTSSWSKGAGSPAEVNLRPNDIANMGFARAAGVPVCLVGDIDRGGVIADLVGTQAVLDPEDAALIVGFVVNRFRGEPSLFADGVTFVERRTGWRCFGLVHWLPAATRLPPEDTASIARNGRADVARDSRRRKEQPTASAAGAPGVRHCGAATPRRIVAPILSRMANFDDADPLRLDPGVDFAFVPPGRPIPRDADVVVLFGTKSTVGELAFLRAQGWDHDIIAHARGGARVLGVSGGYQMLGRRVQDLAGVDGPAGAADGLGLLDVETVMAGEKTVRPAQGRCVLSGEAVSGYEIHMGHTQGPDLARPCCDSTPATKGRGTRAAGWRAPASTDCSRTTAGAGRGSPAGRRTVGAYWSFDATVELALDEVATDLAGMLDVDALFAAARAPAP